MMQGTTDAQQRMVSESLLLEVLPLMCNVSITLNGLLNHQIKRFPYYGIKKFNKHF